jgi:hypothetical protein
MAAPADPEQAKIGDSCRIYRRFQANRRTECRNRLSRPFSGNAPVAVQSLSALEIQPIY